MTTQRRLTTPSRFDNEYMVTTMTPESISVEFFEDEKQALEAARLNVHPTTTTYVSRIIKQGEHRIRGSSKHIAVLAEIDRPTELALLRHSKARGRKQVQKVLTQMLDTAMRDLVEAPALSAARWARDIFLQLSKDP